MPSADEHDAQLTDWRKAGESKTASTKARFDAQQKWLQDQISTYTASVTYWQDDRDSWTTTKQTFLTKGGIPDKTSDYVSTYTVGSGGIYNYDDQKVYDAFFPGNNPITSDIGGSSGTIWSDWVVLLNKYLKPIKASIRNAQSKATSAQNLLDVYSQALEQLQYTGDPLKISVFTQVVSGNGQGLITAIDNANQDFVYNASGVVDAYFRSGETFTYELNNNKYQVMGSNTPKIVGSAKELWQNSANHKGMISSIDYNKIFGTTDSKGKFTAKTPIVPSTPSKNKDGSTTYTPYTGLDLQFDLKNKKQYAFQFLYNPGSVDMTFMGTPDIDVGYEISGSDQFSLIGGLGITQSTITFDLVINRMFDMKYYESSTQHLKEPFKTNPSLVYKGKTPTTAEQQLIYRRGTMYDVDYLLRTLLGYAGPTTLRFDASGAGTADIGYLGAMPVELHLGQNLRYLGIVNGLSVRHVIFNERMVPLFSTLHVQFNRIPDFPSTGG